MIEKLKATICTLNEERNIAECIKHIEGAGVTNILVVDASSEDKTAEIARSCGAKVITVPKIGLSSQRKRCVDETETEFVVLLDADHRPTSDAFTTLLIELSHNKWDGIEAQIRSVSNQGYWDSAMEHNFEISHNMVGPRVMIGTPCIYKTSVLRKVNFDPQIIGPADDTDLCYRLVKAGYRLGVGSAVIHQAHRSTFFEFVKKWLWYGLGDYEFVTKHPNRFYSILKHQLWRYMIVKSIKSIWFGKPLFVPFFLMAGGLRFIGMSYYFLKKFLLGVKPLPYKT